MGDPLNWRSSVKDLEFLLPVNEPEHNYIIHDINLSYPKFLRDINFHAILLGPTFLCARYSPSFFKKILERYSFVKSSEAVKLAFPQDEYDCNQSLDDWMIDWGVDTVYSVISDHHDVLYPRYSKKGQIELSFTGFITEDLIDRFKQPKIFIFIPVFL